MSQAKLLNTKITKGQVDEAVAAGITHAKFRNKGVQKRLMKNRAKVQREQDRREAHFKLVNKHKQAMIDQQRTVYTEAATAQPVVQEGADALQALFGDNLPKVDPETNIPERADLGHEHTPANVEMMATHEFLDLSQHHGEAYFPALGGVVDFSKPASSVAVSFDAESKGLVIRPEDMQKAVDESIERVPAGGYRYGTDLAVIMADKPMITEDGLVIGGESMIRTPIEFGEPGRYPLNLYGDEIKYKKFPDINEVVPADGPLMITNADGTKGVKVTVIKDDEDSAKDETFALKP
jgi:hypothetical protein